MSRLTGCSQWPCLSHWAVGPALSPAGWGGPESLRGEQRGRKRCTSGVRGPVLLAPGRWSSGAAKVTAESSCMGSPAPPPRSPCWVLGWTRAYL